MFFFLLPGCKGMWDIIACWPSAKVGEHVVIPCPNYFRHFSDHHEGKLKSPSKPLMNFKALSNSCNSWRKVQSVFCHFVSLSHGLSWAVTSMQKQMLWGTSVSEVVQKLIWNSHKLTGVVSLISDFSRQSNEIGEMVTLKQTLICQTVNKKYIFPSRKQDFSGMLLWMYKLFKTLIACFVEFCYFRH